MKNILLIAVLFGANLSAPSFADELAHVKVTFKKLCASNIDITGKVFSDHNHYFDTSSKAFRLIPGHCMEPSLLPKFSFTAKIPMMNSWASIDLREDRFLGYQRVGKIIAFLGVECPPAQYDKAKCVNVANLQKGTVQIPYVSEYANMIVELAFVAFETLQPTPHTRNTP